MEVTRTMTVWCLDWPVVALAGSAAVEAGPVAVLHANRVVAASPAARAEGVQRGIRRRDAQGRCPDLEVLDRDPLAEARAFEDVLAAVETYTPLIEVTRPGTCAFATRGPSRYFGGDDALAGRVAMSVAEVLAGRTVCRIGAADGPFAAGIAARSRQASLTNRCIVEPGESPDYLAPLSVTTLEQPELTDVLLRLGIRRLGEFAALPATDVIGRFGAVGLGAHRLASGLDERPPQAREIPDDLRFSAELDPPVNRVDQAAFRARTLAEDLHAELSRRGTACTRIAIEAETEHGEQLIRLWRHEGALSAGAIAERIRWQLDGWLNGRLGGATQRPTAGLTRITLAPDELTAASGRQLGFWGGESAADDRAVRALTRVEAMLGPESVRVPQWRGGRGIGEQLELVPVQSVDPVQRTLKPPTEGVDAPWPGQLPTPSPALVHPFPPDVEVLAGNGDQVTITGRGLASAVPAQIKLRGSLHAIVAWAGPWLVDERWWDPDNHRRRARLQVVTGSGVAHILTLEQQRWYVEATYD